MSFESDEPDQLTTAEVAALTGRSQTAVRLAVLRDDLTGTRLLDGWRINRVDALAWHARTRQPTRLSARPWERAAELLEEFGSMSTQEMTPLLGRHEGNTRKYLAILRAEGRAERLPDGQWVLIKRHVGAA